MGEEQRLSPEEQLATARAAFEAGTDFTVAVEEEFALLDGETLALANRFEEVQAAAKGTEVEPHLVGELIASEAEVRTGKCADFAEAAATLVERRGQLAELTRGLGLALGAAGTHPWSRWQDQRIIDTPHYRRNDQLLRYVVWRNNTFGLHVHVGIRGADRAIAVCNAMRRFLPELLALSASSPFVEEVDTGLHSARTQLFTRTFPRCGIPDVYEGWRGFEDYVAFLYRTRSIDEHTQLWWSVRPHLAYPTVEIRICDAQPDPAQAQSLAALAYSLTVRCARAIDEGEPLPDLPNRMLEENLWRAIRYGLSGELLDFELGGPVPARARIEALIEWVAPLAAETGAAPFLAVPAANSAERQQALGQDGATLEEIYATEGLGDRGLGDRGLGDRASGDRGSGDRRRGR
jgi:glutamate---cysteine ligase / carboxylate-amine ligase